MGLQQSVGQVEKQLQDTAASLTQELKQVAAANAELKTATAEALRDQTAKIDAVGTQFTAELQAFGKQILERLGQSSEEAGQKRRKPRDDQAEENGDAIIDDTRGGAQNHTGSVSASWQGVLAELSESLVAVARKQEEKSDGKVGSNVVKANLPVNHQGSKDSAARPGMVEGSAVPLIREEHTQVGIAAVWRKNHLGDAADRRAPDKKQRRIGKRGDDALPAALEELQDRYENSRR